MTVDRTSKKDKGSKERDNSAKTVDASAEDLANLLANAEEATRERAQFRDLLQRTQADFVNYKRRVEDEKNDLVKRANVDLLSRLLPSLDDFERALENNPLTEKDIQWREGIVLIYRNLMATLESYGLRKVSAQDLPFDPREHEALLYEEAPDLPDGTVLRVIRDGYGLHDRILRPAQVSVSHRAEVPSDPQSSPLKYEDGADNPDDKEEA